MNKSFLLLFLLVFSFDVSAQSEKDLRKQLHEIISAKKARLGVAIISQEKADTLSVNGNGHFPLQSVFKFHIAMFVLSEVDKGTLSLDQTITIQGKELLPGLHSPIREKFPNGATLSLAEVITYTVSESDNAGCDALLRLVGGTSAVEAFFHGIGFKDLSIKFNEETMQSNWENQYRNWTTPKEASRLLAAFFQNSAKILSDRSYDFLLSLMKASPTGPTRIKGLLPAGTVVAHKTGTSGTNEQGVMAAVNDIGIVFLPNGKFFLISVFVSDSKEDFSTNERIIADVAKAAWNDYNR